MERNSIFTVCLITKQLFTIKMEAYFFMVSKLNVVYAKMTFLGTK